MINDLLDLAKIEAGRVTVVAGEVPFDALRESVQRSFGHLAQDKGLALAIDLAPELPAAIYTDALRLRQVLRNLIGNAIKFTAAGRVTLRIEPAATGWSAQHPILSRAPMVIALSVSDTGIGIAPDKQQMIFEAFQQAEGGIARKYGGTGLGLSISREIAHLLGGELTLRSQPGVGSTFTLYLPLGTASTTGVEPSPAGVLATPGPLADGRAHVVPDDAMDPIDEDDAISARLPETQRQALERQHEAYRPLAGRKVLLVDDDVRNVFATTALLEDHDVVVVPALSGEEALALLPKHPDTATVLMDIMMPQMDGYDTMRAIRRNSKFRALPIIALTAKAMKGDREKCLEAGASDYISKPVNVDQLLSLMRIWLYR
jgi:CheY-like chemotaxis protein/two-component sensor histidine kinase